jgi:NDP-sugar pyrophosphorylase family protein
MKTILLCPNQASGIPVLADAKPAAALPFLGEPFISHWLHELAARKTKEVRLITSDAPEILEALVGDGSRWGLATEVLYESRDLKPDEARKKHRPAYEHDWAPAPFDVIEADHFPGAPEHKLFSSYEHWFAAFALSLPHVVARQRIGLREVQPGVWVGRRSRIASSAKLEGPCWIGENVRIGKNAVIGPNAFIEDQTVIDAACTVTNSWVGPNTFLGSLTELNGSLASGNLLVNWKTGSHTLVPDPFLMASLARGRKQHEAARETIVSETAPEPRLARAFSRVIPLSQKLQS